MEHIVLSEMSNLDVNFSAQDLKESLGAASTADLPLTALVQPRVCLRLSSVIQIPPPHLHWGSILRKRGGRKSPSLSKAALCPY